MALAPTAIEVKMLSKYALERCVKYFPEVKYYAMIPPKPDIVYTDTLGEDFKDPVIIHPFVEESPSVELLEKWGFTKDHPIVIIAMKLELDNLGIFPKDQDIFVYKKMEYEVEGISVQPTNLFGPQNLLIGVAMAANIKPEKIYEDSRIDRKLFRRSDQKRDVLGYDTG